jgi:hypothetical protein
MTTTVERFKIKGGGDALIGDVGGQDLWVLVIGGATLSLGYRADWRIAVDPFPHAWRVTVTPKGSESSLWFDVAEADAMRIDALVNP